jgi:hypothetical protein
MSAFADLGNNEMNGKTDIFTNAVIKPGRRLKITCQGKYQVVYMYQVMTTVGDTFFECLYEWVQNDFFAIVVNFGWPKITLAGSTDDRVRKKFSKQESASAKLLIENYFIGGAGKGDFPLKGPTCHCLGVKFTTNWILVQP